MNSSNPWGWLCAGCGVPADEHFLTDCGCVTACLFQQGGSGHRNKANACVHHPNRPVRVNLDGDDLCQQCADQWVRSEGLALLSDDDLVTLPRDELDKYKDQVRHTCARAEKAEARGTPSFQGVP